VVLADNAEAAAVVIGVKVEIEKITDLVDIVSLGVMSTPGLVIDDKIVSTGKISSVAQIAEQLSMPAPEQEIP